MAENILTTTEAIDYNVVSSDRGSANLTTVLSNADADFRLNENHIHDDLGGTIGKSGTLVHEAINDGDGILDGVFTGPDRYVLTDAGSNDVKNQVTSSHYSQTNPHFIVMDEVNKDDDANFGRAVGDACFNSFLNVDAKEKLTTATTISGLRTALIQKGDIRWTSDAMLGRKDIHGKFVYVDFDGTNYSLKLNNCVSDAACLTMPPKSKLKPILDVQTVEVTE